METACCFLETLPWGPRMPAIPLASSCGKGPLDYSLHPGKGTQGLGFLVENLRGTVCQVHRNGKTLLLPQS